MTDTQTKRATLMVIAAGTLWGFYWVPVRALDAAGLPGAWGTALIVAIAALSLVPHAIRQFGTLRRADRAALAYIALGGAGFVLYSVGLVYGRIAVIILLFFLTPVWSTLIGRVVMGWATPRLRIAAIVTGILGLGIMLGAGGGLPVPRGIGEWMALLSGITWAIATIGIRVRPAVPPGLASFVFAAGATLCALALAPFLSGLPTPNDALLPALPWAVAAGTIWWAACMAGLMWATVRLDPPRVGILLMIEVLVGTASAAWLAGEVPLPQELVGGALVLIAGILEVWPVRKRAVVAQ
ncbi:DMT family transporter [Roseivivax sp. THAF30]|jgi:drug/metabolite transporter (DMT)-like permease|uniref:DMT family transporter n=1 Tax=Roseivivax sp. THAF30 TaxID=2587852 RepID=UPI001268A9B1|nr:DMT family transporter [Roseivivax sp. THAF30]QFT64745.1 EamA-like transporter family protein [Roseivivax sp. THAF30]